MFIGVSLSRKSQCGNPDSITHQTSFDFNEVLDRNYEYVQSFDDDGWLVGGGEPGPPRSSKIPAKDTGHIEIMRIGPFQHGLESISEEEIIRSIYSGKILIPQIEILPTSVSESKSLPADLQIRFDMEPAIPNFDDANAPLPINWSLRFVQNQLFRNCQCQGKMSPDSFHTTILKRISFRSNEHKTYYMSKCYNTIKAWREKGQQPLNNEGWDIDGTPLAGFVGAEASRFNSGLWLFQDRHTITHFFPPNFLPPYDTPEKRSIILDCLRQEWDEQSSRWRPAGYKLYERMRSSARCFRRDEAKTTLESDNNCPQIAFCGVADSCIQS